MQKKYQPHSNQEKNNRKEGDVTVENIPKNKKTKNDVENMLTLKKLMNNDESS